MKRRDFLKTAGLSAAGAFAARDMAQASQLLLRAAGGREKPNIIFILADDLGIGNLSCYGSDTFKTPHIDEMARGGVRFTHGYTPALCGPSRACILTGRYGFRTGATNQDSTGMMQPENETMIPRVLQSAGYRTASVGKWGQLPLTPSEFGFDEHFTYTGSGKYWNSQKGTRFYSVSGAKTELKDGEYLPDLMHDFAVRFIARQQSNPFFLYYSLSHIHGPILPTPESAVEARDLYADNISYMDGLIGKLRAELNRLRLAEKTLIVFFGDNGTAKNFAERATIGGRRLSGQKGTMLEGGSLVPFILSGAPAVPKGEVCEDLVDSTDFLPTFAELAGADLPAGKTIDGHSFAARLNKKKARPREWVFLQLGPSWYVRDLYWKLNHKGELFDMRNAPFEESLIEGAGSEEAIKARQKLEKILSELHPGAGIIDTGDGTGRHANKKEKKNKKRRQ